ncbi:alpha-D-ribose 1-methylphosphonate 5-triphosphate diphosphatase [Paracoccus aerodenitrificans]|uniref:alpha-D-ribose 1-methylphosphonate 5-triphosphate diphosphatase n=1 Tax=Paracoccus aerodenitrificans TaxID=3017781 RepID=UPI0022F04A7C|nr:alpha-D-ribose 1-methylphosphonate 5-triphosphate diphosphatase [Paracoccus aerodenitrificans]WBU64386.1 alpha-D-ribose 1-methylphosphonate 5-triphosphate diphosphatase [Paracoccus aerodenitrificans]
MILANADLVLSDRVMRGALHIEGETITAITEGPAVPVGAVDCEGDLLIPGLIELHTDNLERHMQPRPGVDWPHDTAILAHDGELASVGITTVFDALRVGSIYGTAKGYAPYALALAEEINALNARQATRISHFIHLRAEICSETLVEEMEAFGDGHRVRLVSLMDHTPGQRQFRDLKKLEEYEKGKHGMSDAQFTAHVEMLTSLRNRIGDRHETEAVRLAGEFGATLASHDDTTAAQVQTSAGHGVKLAEFPTTVEAAQASRDAGIKIIMGAPNLIRGGSHSGNVAAKDLAQKGLLDILSSDYVPSSLLMASCRLAVMWDDLPRAIATVTSTPAEATGLTDRGRIAEGLRADLVRVADARQTPRVRGVWCRGRCVG